MREILNPTTFVIVLKLFATLCQKCLQKICYHCKINQEDREGVIELVILESGAGSWNGNRVTGAVKGWDCNSSWNELQLKLSVI